MGNPRPRITTTTSQLHDMHKALEKRRRRQKYIEVDREALENILMDHSELLRAMEEHGIKTRAGRARL